MTIEMEFKATTSDWSNGLTLDHLRVLVGRTTTWPGDLPVRVDHSNTYELQIGGI